MSWTHMCRAEPSCQRLTDYHLVIKWIRWLLKMQDRHRTPKCVWLGRSGKSPSSEVLHLSFPTKLFLYPEESKGKRSLNEPCSKQSLQVRLYRTAGIRWLVVGAAWWRTLDMKESVWLKKEFHRAWSRTLEAADWYWEARWTTAKTVVEENNRFQGRLERSRTLRQPQTRWQF